MRNQVILPSIGKSIWEILANWSPPMRLTRQILPYEGFTMVMYCTCIDCLPGPGQPNAVIVGEAEPIRGALTVIQAGWTLAHWSANDFNLMRSREIHCFHQGQHQFRVGASFYLYHGGVVPLAAPQQLAVMGLGGPIRYTINQAVAEATGLQVYVKTPGAPSEVAVILGCAGSIAFDAAHQATGATIHPARAPILTLNR